MIKLFIPGIFYRIKLISKVFFLFSKFVTFEPLTIIIILVNVVQVYAVTGIKFSFESECSRVTRDTPFDRNARLCESGRSHNSINGVYFAITFNEGVRAARKVHTFRHGQGTFRGNILKGGSLAHQNDPGPIQSMAGFPLVIS